MASRTAPGWRPARCAGDPVDRQHAEPQPAALDLAAGSRRRQDGGGDVGRDREADASSTELVDPDDLALHVDQRAAGVARQDQGIVLDPAGEETRPLAVLEVQVPDVVGGGASEDPVRVRDDAQRHRRTEHHRVAHREHLVSRLERRGVAELGERQRRGRAPPLQAQLEDAQVGERVVGDDAGLELLAARQPAEDARRMRGDVVVRQHVAVRADDDAAAGGARPPRVPLLEVPLDHRDVDQRRIDPAPRFGHRARGCVAAENGGRRRRHGRGRGCGRSRRRGRRGRRQGRQRRQHDAGEEHRAACVA